MADAQWTGDMSGMTFSMDGAALMNGMLSHIITAIETNAAFRQAIVNAIMPQVRQVAATTAASTAGGKKTTK